MEFIKRHGGSVAVVREQGRDVFLLPSGAVVANNGSCPILREPPQPVGGRANLEARRRYHTVKAESAEDGFKRLKGALTGTMPEYVWNERDHGPLPNRDGKTALLRLKEIAQQHRAAVADLDRAIAELPEERERREREVRGREFRTAIKDHVAQELAELNAIKLD